MQRKNTGMKSQTLTIASEMVAETTRNMPYEVSVISTGNTISISAISLEKRVRILPIGLESKKMTLARMIEYAILLCKLEVALMHMWNKVNSRIHATTRFAAINPIRTFG